MINSFKGWELFKTRLKKKMPQLVDIIEWDEYGYCSKEIIVKCGKCEKQTSWYDYQWTRIKNAWIEFNNPPQKNK